MPPSSAPRCLRITGSVREQTEVLNKLRVPLVCVGTARTCTMRCVPMRNRRSGSTPHPAAPNGLAIAKGKMQERKPQLIEKHVESKSLRLATGKSANNQTGFAISAAMVMASSVSVLL